MTPPDRPPLRVLVVVLALFLAPAGPARADGPSLGDLAATLNIDPGGISVSGISSGAYMAQQFHVIHARHVIGAGLLAGGPYNCAGGDYYLSLFYPGNLYAALHVCSDTSLQGIFTGPPDVARSLASTRREAAAGTIDDPTNLKTDKVWLFSGGNDETIPGAVVDSVKDYYQTFLDADAVALVRNAEAGHAMITEDFGNACDAEGEPYINDCDFDAAEALLGHIYGPAALEPMAGRDDLKPVTAFDQTQFFDETDASTSLHARGYVYVPERCESGGRCRLHVAFHGCRQDQDAIGDGFYGHAGYNAVAETNDIVVLYPQTKVWSENVFTDCARNPRACWDWWGYSGADFHRRSGKQVRAVAGMINVLVGEELLGLE